MHLGNGAITPECAAITYTVATTGLGWAAWSLRSRQARPGQFAMAGALGAAVFAAQMINVPLLPLASAHFVGGVLLAWVLGAELGALTMAVVLALQALLLGDGGLAALGANILNMSLLPAGLTALARGRLSAEVSSPLKYAGVGAFAALAVLGGAMLVVAETAAIGGGDLGQFTARMLLSHAWIGLLEGLATVALVIAVDRSLARNEGRFSRAAVAVTSATTVLLIAVALPLASSLPDGYEAAADSTGWGRLLSEDGAWMESLGGWNAASASLQQRVTASVESLLGAGQLLAFFASALAGLASLAIAALLGHRRLVPVSVPKHRTRRG